MSFTSVAIFAAAAWFAASVVWLLVAMWRAPHGTPADDYETRLDLLDRPPRP